MTNPAVQRLFLIAALGGLLAACAVLEPLPVGSDAAPADTPDCGPGAEETLDGLDNDCDGLVDELEVCAMGGAPFATLGAAIAVAPPGATIRVCAGTYRETVTIAAKSLHLIGVSGAAATIVDADATGRAFSIQGTGVGGVTLEGFTIRNGLTAAEGGGVRCQASTLRVIDSVVIDNAAHHGGGLYAIGCGLDIAGTRFERNDGDREGGGVMLVDSSGQLRSSELVDNRSVHGGGLMVREGTVAILDNQFRNNVAALLGGALYHDSDGLIAGNSVTENQSGWAGGGIFVLAHAPTLRDNTVSGNAAINDGGGIYVHESRAELLDNRVTDNVAGDDGGGIRLFESAAYLEANVVERNHAADGGGGIRVSHVPATLVDNLVRDNTATNTGGGLDLDNDSSTVRGGEISGNTASSGAGIYAMRGPWTGYHLEDIVISGNHAWRGGGIALDDNFEPVAMHGLTITDNTASKGAGLFVRATDFTLENSVFAGNQADRGGALYVGVNSSWWEPCPCPPLQPTSRVNFVVLYGNLADQGSAVWTDSPGLSVENSILLENHDPAVRVAAPEIAPGVVVAPRWRFNDTFPATFSGMDLPTGSQGNLATNPRFVSAGSGDFHLIAASPCVDAGDPAVEDANGTRADMGAFGGTP